MRKQWIGAALAAALTFSIGAIAQDQQSAPADQQQQKQGYGKHRGMHKGMGKMDPQARLDHMAAQLNLTEDQKTQIKPILEKSQQEMQALRSDTSSDRMARREKAMQIHTSTMAQIRPILTSEQQQKLDQLQKQRKQRWEGRKNRTEAPKPTPQS